MVKKTFWFYKNKFVETFCRRVAFPQLIFVPVLSVSYSPGPAMSVFSTPDDVQKFDALFYSTGDKKVKGVTHVPKNKNHPWRVFFPGMEARCFFFWFV